MENVLFKKRHIKTAFVFLFLFFSTNLTFSQVTLSLKNGTLGEVIQTIKSQTQYRFFYDDGLTKLKVGNVEGKNMPVKELLDKVLPPIGVTYKIDAQIIYLYPKDKKKQESAKKDNSPRRIIKGNVTDSSGEPLIGVSVSVKGTTTGTVTDMDGNYTLTVPAGYNDLQFSYVGFKTEQHSISSDENINISLKEDAKAIDEVVVTALGIKKEKKMLGYSVQELKGDELNRTGDPSITGALQGKVAGLQMNTSSTGLNGSTKITIRGNSSLVDNNQPLWVVDGVPFTEESTSTASAYSGYDRGSTTVDINPEDIETISVLKGPNAAALYGSRAGNGVILITTKKGTKSNGFGVSYNGNFTWTQVASTLDMQDKYGQGTNNEYSDTPYSFGPALDGHEYTTFTGENIPFKKYGNKLKDFFETGFSQTHNVAIGNVKEDSNYRASFGSTEANGVFSREHMSKINVDLTAGMKMNKYLSVDSKISLSRTKTENRPLYGKNGAVYQLLFIPNNIRLSDLKDNYTSPDKAHINWTGPFEEVLNPYFIENQYGNSDERWRAFGYYGLKLNFTDWLHGSAKYAFDYYNTTFQTTDITKCLDVMALKDQKQDRLDRSESRFFEQNAEFMLFGNNKIGNRIQLGYSLGSNIMIQHRTSLDAFSVNMRKKEVWQMNSALGVNGANAGYMKKQINSVFGTFQFTFDNYLTLDLTARNDWSSTLPSNHRSFFYPSANLSFVATDFMRNRDWTVPSWLTFAKVRLSAAQVGKDTDPYQLCNWLDYKQTGNTGSFTSPNTLIRANAMLKPEISTSYEGGVELKFFQNRLGLDFTYYNSRTKNQVLVVPMTGSFNGKYINAGLVGNKGVELMLYGTPVQTKDFSFDLTVNISHNKSEVIELAPEKKEVIFNEGESNFIIDVGAREGGKLGDIYPIQSYKRDANGNVVIRDGYPLLEETKGEDRKAIGNIQPKLQMSVTPTFSYKGIYLSALFDMKFGGDIVSMSESVATNYGTAKRTENRGEIIVPGVNEDGTPNRTPVNAETYYKRIANVAEEFLYDASFIKLKEISLGYSFPKSLLKKTPFTNLKVAFVGRNLCYLMSHTPGTSPEGGYDTSMFSQAFDFTSIPYTRTLGFSISVGF